jgi:hypothetical protein
VQKLEAEPDYVSLLIAKKQKSEAEEQIEYERKVEVA